MTLILEYNNTGDGYDCVDVSSENCTIDDCVVHTKKLTNLQNTPKANEYQIIQNPYYEDADDTIDGMDRYFLHNGNSDVGNVTVIKNLYYDIVFIVTIKFT